MTQKGFVYKLVSKETDKIYIGSTIKSLAVRLYYHYRDKSNITSKQILMFGDATIELIETVAFNHIKELRLKEKEYIQKYRDICVNERGIYKDRKECSKEWRAKNREKIRNYDINRRKKKREENPPPPPLTEEQKKANKKKYMLEHKKDKQIYDKEYREKNKEKLSKEIMCECGGRYKQHHKSTHLKTKKHINNTINQK